MIKKNDFEALMSIILTLVTLFMFGFIFLSSGASDPTGLVGVIGGIFMLSAFGALIVVVFKLLEYI